MTDDETFLTHSADRRAGRRKPVWIAYEVLNDNYDRNREQFNGDKPAWGESVADWQSKQGVDVPVIGDEISTRNGVRTVYNRRLDRPEEDDNGELVTDWCWTVFVR